jgi:hypothetical protein
MQRLLQLQLRLVAQISREGLYGREPFELQDEPLAEVDGYPRLNNSRPSISYAHATDSHGNGHH